MPSPIFYTRDGRKVPGLSQEAIGRLRAQVQEEYGITPLQMIEASSFSYAMVVRFALGLSAEGGRTIAVIGDTFPGWVTLATLRHLINGGAHGCVFLVGELGGDISHFSPEAQHQLRYLAQAGVEIKFLPQNLPPHPLHDALKNAHNVLCGLSTESTDDLSFLVDCLNETSVPIHSTEMPLGVNRDTGAPSASPLFSSSTLSLGVPLVGLLNASDYAGRHYVCDISLPRSLTNQAVRDFPILFADQPVQQLFWEEPGSEATE
jgi:NAD(P)H-hydrate repair Nnr-like enzyme with NAD(P)H-hydrate epimerase domain